jgi:hypothetical protein
VIWELIATPKGGDNHEFTNNVWVHTTEDFERYLAAKKLNYDQIHKGFQAAVDAHNAEETPNFAASIQRLALARKRAA